MIPVGHGDNESVGKSGDHLPRANRGMAGRQAREWDRGGKRKKAVDAW
jgi:hypothetical protein